MKRFLPFYFLLCLTIFLSGCYSAKKQYERGNYDFAIQLAAKKLRKKPNDQKKIEILVNSWEIANKADQDDLNREMAEANVNWERVYLLYKKMDDRQRIVKQLPRLKPTNPQTDVDFTFVDYSAVLSNTKLKAIQDLEGKGDYYMNLGGRFNARTAYDFYYKAYGYDKGYAGLAAKLDDAYNAGMTNVTIQLAPQSQVFLPDNFVNTALNKNWSNLQSSWLRFYTGQRQGFSSHYFVDALITQVFMSPERIQETTYTDSKSIEDGWEYAKNPDGSVRTDTLGNKIKVPVFRKVTCKVTRYTLTKDATVNGMVIIYGTDSDNKYANDPIYGTFAYNYVYGAARGDTRALSKESYDLVNKAPGGFPSNNEMLMNAAYYFGNALYDKVNQYKYVFQ